MLKAAAGWGHPATDSMTTAGSIANHASCCTKCSASRMTPSPYQRPRLGGWRRENQGAKTQGRKESSP